MKQSFSIWNCGRCGSIHKERICVAQPLRSDQVTRHFHDWPPCGLLANRLILLSTSQLVATSQCIFLLVIRSSAALKSHILAQEWCTKRFGAYFGSAKLNVMNIPCVQLQRQSDIQTMRLLWQTVELSILQLPALRKVFCMVGAMFWPCWA